MIIVVFASRSRGDKCRDDDKRVQDNISVIEVLLVQSSRCTGDHKRMVDHEGCCGVRDRYQET